MAMGLQIARVLRSPYAAVHMRRLLAATERGRTLVANLESGAAARPEQAVAIGYATSLTEDVHGIDDARFRQVRGYYNDAQIVELTLTVSFFNYFTRLVEAVNLPVEQWALDSPPAPGPAARERYAARVNLISDAQMQWAAGVVNAQRQRTGPRSGDDFGLVNSQRAMNLVPDISAAWRGYTGATGADAAVSREIKLHVSFAVSMANGCRYCTLHQVQGLRRLGVSPEKLLAMAKDDSALTPRELAAVVFARKLTHTPPQITDGDYEALRREFGERGAFEVVLQTCNFAFMNRFTDNLGLPSEDEAVRTYREVYGRDWKSR
jgi:AhpD family alkylhydroperoxidase